MPDEKIYTLKERDAIKAYDVLGEIGVDAFKFESWILENFSDETLGQQHILDFISDIKKLVIKGLPHPKNAQYALTFRRNKPKKPKVADTSKFLSGLTAIELREIGPFKEEEIPFK